MNKIKRIFISLLRNRKRTMITLFLFFLIFSLFLSAQLIAQGSRRIINTVNSNLQPITILTSSYELQTNGEAEDMETALITSETVTLMENYEEVESVNYSYGAFAFNSMKKYEAELQNEVYSTRIEIVGSEIGLPEISKIREETIISGEEFSKSNIESGEAVVIIHKEYAELNGLVVGDTLTIESKLFEQNENFLIKESTVVKWQEIIPLTIVGIVSQSEGEPKQERNEKDDDFLQRNSEYARVVNTYYVPNKLIEEMNSNKRSQLPEENEHLRVVEIPAIYIKLYSLESQSSFVKNVQKDMQFPWVLVTSEEMVNTIVQLLRSFDELFGIGMIVALILFSLILLLIIFYQIKGRSTELGLYLALGETRREILSNILGEYVSLGSISMFFSIICMKLFENGLNDIIISNQLLSNTGEKQQSVFQGLNLIESKTQDKIITALNSMANDEISSMYIIYASLLFLIALLIAVGLMYIYIKRINVKKILMSH